MRGDRYANAEELPSLCVIWAHMVSHSFGAWQNLKGLEGVIMKPFNWHTWKYDG